MKVPVDSDAKLAADPRIPLSWYVEPQILELEQSELFAMSPEYLGAAPMVPESGCYSTIAVRDHAEMLVRTESRIHLVSNICRHRNLLMLRGRGRGKQLVCPMHMWRYDLDGKLVTAPRYPEKPCVQLPTEELQKWNGILFSSRRSIADLDMLLSLIHISEPTRPY